MSPASLLLLAALAATAPDPGFDQITGRVGRQGHDASVDQMGAWIAAHPDDPNAGRGLIWMAELRLADHHIDAARELFARAEREYAGSEWGLHGKKGRADLDLASHHYGPALAAYQELQQQPSAYWEYVGRNALSEARGERTRWYIYLVALLGLLAWGGARLAAARRALWPAPEEATWAAPVVGVMLVSALAQQPAEAHAVISVALGALLLLWANGAYLRLRPPGPWRWKLEALLGVVQAVALLYCAVIGNDLWLKFSETLTSGAER